MGGLVERGQSNPSLAYVPGRGWVTTLPFVIKRNPRIFKKTERGSRPSNETNGDKPHSKKTGRVDAG